MPTSVAIVTMHALMGQRTGNVSFQFKEVGSVDLLTRSLLGECCIVQRDTSDVVNDEKKLSKIYPRT